MKLYQSILGSLAAAATIAACTNTAEKTTYSPSAISTPSVDTLAETDITVKPTLLQVSRDVGTSVRQVGENIETITRDELGRPTAYSMASQKWGSDEVSAKWKYDAKGNITKFTHTDGRGTSNPEMEVTTFEYRDGELERYTFEISIPGVRELEYEVGLISPDGDITLVTPRRVDPEDGFDPLSVKDILPLTLEEVMEDAREGF